MRKLLVLAAPLVAAGGCDGGGTGVPRVASVTVSAGSREITALYRTVQLSAAARDRNGAAIAKTRFTWATLDASVASTDSVGRVTGTSVGTARVVAAAGNAADTVLITVRQIPASVRVGTAPTVVVAGDTLRLSATAVDSGGAAAPGAGLSWSSSAPLVASVGATGTVRGESAGQATVRVTADDGATDSVAVTVIPSPCAPGQPALVLAVGEVRTLAGPERNTICASGGAAGSAEYTLIPFRAVIGGAGAVQIDISAANVAPAAMAAASAATAPLRLTRTAATGENLLPDLPFERALRARARAAMEPRAAAARRVYEQAAGPGGSAMGARLTRAAALPQRGDTLSLNVNAASGCSAPDRRPGRVAAVSQRAVIVADTANPVGGFSDDDYAALAATFDDLVWPVDVNTFGAPSDIDSVRSGGRVVIFFTRAVNELTPANSTSYVGGFFYGRDLLPRVDGQGATVCAGSNEAEMFYMLVPDTGGVVVPGNRRGLDFVRTRSPGVLAHEFQHLINASRRLYINHTPVVDEDGWLNEGLSHIAEELAFYQASGLGPRRNLDLAAITANPAVLDAVNGYQVSNLGRLTYHLRAPGANSPFAEDDELATRGATWQLLRYAADQRGGDERALWFALANGPATGLDNLGRAIGQDPIVLARDWAVAQYTDDAVSQARSIYTHPSWNFRSVLPAVDLERRFPLALTQIVPGSTTSVRVRGASAVYVRFGVNAGTVGGLGVSTAGGVVPPDVALLLVRTK